MVRLHIDDGGQIRTVELPSGKHLVGRAAEAAVHIDAPNVSRRHAWLHVDDERLWVEDLGSVWGTFVDGERVQHEHKHVVPTGSLLHFAQVAVWNGPRDRANRAAAEAEFPAALDAEQTVTWIAEDAVGRGRTIRMLRHLFGLLREEGFGTSIEEEGCLFVRDWVDSDRVCVRVADEAGHLPETRAWWSRAPYAGHQLLISQSIVDEALRTGRAVVWSGTDARLRHGTHDSWQALNISSAAAVPIRAEPDVRGVLYVDRLGRGSAFDGDDLDVLVAAASAIATKREIIVTHIDREEAARIQLRMLPQSLPRIAGYELEKDLRLCRSVGGDIYDCIERRDGTLVFLVADVSGKGITAALIAAGTSLLFHALVDLSLGPLEIFRALHRNLGAKLEEGQFVALVLGCLDPASGRIRIVVAGIPFPVVIRADGRRELLPVTACPAALTELGPPPAEHVFDLDPGDLLAVFSDGFPEATPDGLDFFGMESVIACIDTLHTGPLEAIREHLLRSVAEFVGASGPSDDQTLFLLRRSST